MVKYIFQKKYHCYYSDVLYNQNIETSYTRELDDI